MSGGTTEILDLTTGGTFTVNNLTAPGCHHGRQALGFCEQHSLVHAWLSPDYSTYPGHTLRYCANCGRVQRRVPETWEDYT